MSRTSFVPLRVPSLFHSSRPWFGVYAEKNTCPCDRVSHRGVGLPPGLMFFTITVPCLVPSLFQSSRPWVPSSAQKNRVLPTRTNSEQVDLNHRYSPQFRDVGKPSSSPGLMSFTSRVARR